MSAIAINSLPKKTMRSMRVTGSALDETNGRERGLKAKAALKWDSLLYYKQANCQTVILPCGWTEGPCNDKHQTHLNSEKVTNELIHPAYKLFTTMLTPLKTNRKVNFKLRNRGGVGGSEELNLGFQNRFSMKQILSHFCSFIWSHSYVYPFFSAFN